MKQDELGFYGCYKEQEEMDRSISSSIYPIDSLRKRIRAKRTIAFSETCCGSKEHKLRFQERVDTFDVVLKLIRGII